MSEHTEMINKLSAVQAQIWGTVSQVASEACNQMVSFSDPLTVSTSPPELANEIVAPMLVIQYAYSNAPERVMAVLFSQETLLGLASLIQGTEVEEVDENLVADLRPQFEAIVQGLCLAAGNIRDEPVVATGISIRFQNFQLPQNLVRADFLARVQVAISAEDLSGAVIWLLDGESVEFVTNSESQAQEEAAFLQLQDGGHGGGPANGHGGGYADEGALGILYDIPLEITVELGRVKMVVRDVLELGTGSIVEIDKAAGEPVDVLVNGRLVARGEVVVIDDNFGVRVTEICSAAERIAKMGEAA